MSAFESTWWKTYVVEAIVWLWTEAISFPITMAHLMAFGVHGEIFVDDHFVIQKTATVSNDCHERNARSKTKPFNASRQLISSLQREKLEQQMFGLCSTRQARVRWKVNTRSGSLQPYPAYPTEVKPSRTSTGQCFPPT